MPPPPAPRPPPPREHLLPWLSAALGPARAGGPARGKRRSAEPQAGSAAQTRRDANPERCKCSLYTITSNCDAPHSSHTQPHVTYPTLSTHPTYTQCTPHTRRHTPYVLSTLHAPHTKHRLTPHPSHIRIHTYNIHTRARANRHTSHTSSGPEHQRIRAPNRRPLPPLPACTARGRVAPLPAHAQQAGAPLPFVIGGQRVPRLSLQFDLEGSLQGQSSTLGRAPQVGRSARRPRTPLLLIPPGAPWPPHLLIAKRSGRV